MAQTEEPRAAASEPSVEAKLAALRQLREEALHPGDDATSVREWLSEEVRRRWPQIDPNHAAVDHAAGASGGHTNYCSYAPRTAGSTE